MAVCKLQLRRYVRKLDFFWGLKIWFEVFKWKSLEVSFRKFANSKKLGILIFGYWFDKKLANEFNNDADKSWNLI